MPFIVIAWFPFAVETDATHTEIISASSETETVFFSSQTKETAVNAA